MEQYSKIKVGQKVKIRSDVTLHEIEENGAFFIDYSYELEMVKQDYEKFKGQIVTIDDSMSISKEDRTKYIEQYEQIIFSDQLETAIPYYLIEKVL